jgi:hypothetical protein
VVQVTDDQYQTFLLTMLQESPTSPLGLAIVQLWQVYADKATPNLRYLFARLAAIDMLLLIEARNASLTVGDQVIDTSVATKNLSALRTLAQGELDLATKAFGGPAVGLITHDAPITGADGYLISTGQTSQPYLDGNDGRYAGNIYSPTIRSRYPFP